ncbi:arginase [Deinococcus cellulosilyticus]|uniref:Arginase n=1 Tax=Deinococcus cellulosilyticus (strain DSM 18568 / NBRC 106333 / KACC 11606 / 5516J-15) TaxID=1223518 RepID=A0A511NAK5_DEIC1|nr:arginase [Deinococcus cellulosilyticus]GEM49576.1 hypothetical protein DC3_52110 [Deinococcus cellulosilyticus NBRC 106333 = KACC 11606]
MNTKRASPVLLSIDWDHYAGMVEHVFDSPFWGTPDLEYHRAERWWDLARKRGGGLEVLQQDFPLYGDPLELLQYSGKPVFAALSHDSAWEWLARFEAGRVVNVDSHHDLFSLSGDPEQVRPGNWAGLGIRRGKILDYTCIYPAWHEDVRVTEGFDLERTWQEVEPHFSAEERERIHLERGGPLPDPQQVQAVLLVQSPAWTNPLFDGVFFELLEKLQGTCLTEPLRRV